jgi:uncharacterized protein YndB with AHSA1/START domain
MRLTRLFVVAAGGTAAAAVVGGYVALVTGRLTLDLGVGRRTRPLGPIEVHIAAPRTLVYEVATAPYAPRRPRAIEEQVKILERTDHMVLAAHHTQVGGGLTAVTVETVAFDPPHRIGFRLLRGPVPHVTETFTFDDIGGGTALRYDGELGTDLGPLGEAWGDLVARTWQSTVRESLDQIKSEAERRAGRAEV